MSLSPETRAQLARDVAEAAAAGKCRSCGADVLWVQWRSGKRMPVDAVPDMRPPPKGGTLVLFVSHGKLFVHTYDAVADGPKRNRFTSHFATCPEAGEWRKGR
jgi:hypothetical protein